MSVAGKDFKIDWSSRSELRGPGEGSLGELLLKLRDRLDPEAQGVSISYVDGRIMRKLNREHRGINQTTDVLSFPSAPEKGAFKHLGDIVIGLPVAEKLAKKLVKKLAEKSGKKLAKILCRLLEFFSAIFSS